MEPTKERRPQSDTPQELGFEKQSMVNWFDPRQLISTAVKMVTSMAFGSYADKRELMPVLSKDWENGDNGQRYYDYSQFDDMWLDYVADLGDGWDSTYAIASLLASEELTLDGEKLPRGRALIMGGDEVYPTATRTEYRNRLKGPYSAALPWVDEGKEPPHLYAIPGNHDWYDGLTSFIRLFCQGRWFGGWKTRQKRSYFALKLPHNWWLLGLDVQLESDLDLPQIEYFRKIAKEAMKPGDKVILCTAEPSWVYAQMGDETALRNLDYVEQQIVEEMGEANVAVTLAGDLHHYCRYEGENDGKQKITSGGGGAFLHGTHNLPQSLEKKSMGDEQNYTRHGVYPAPEKSRSLLNRNLFFSYFNPTFSAFLGVVYMLYAWLMESASATFSSHVLEGSLLKVMHDATSVGGVMRAAAEVHLYSPLTGLVSLIIIVALIAFVEASPKQRKRRTVLGIVHGLSHTLMALAAMTLFAKIFLNSSGMRPEDVGLILLFVVFMVAAGYVIGGLLMGLHLIISNRWFAMNRTTAMSSHQVADYKNFLRMQVTEEGLRIIPVAVDRVPREWKFNGEGPSGSPWFKPAEGDIKIKRIESDIKISN